MPGKSTQNSTTSQTQNATQNSTTNPWAAADPALQGILSQLSGSLNNTGVTGAENSAYGTLTGNANNYASTYAPQFSNYAGSLLNGGGATAQAPALQGGLTNYQTVLSGANGAASGNLSGYQSALDNVNGAATGNLSGYQSALNNANSAASGNLGGYQTALNGANSAAGQTLADYQQRLTPTANGSLIGRNPALQSQLDTLRNDITNQTNGSFAAAGRDFSGANSMALGRGIEQGLAPVLANQYNVDTANQRAAADALYGAGNTTGAFQAGNAGAGFGAGQAINQFQAGNAGAGFGAGQSTGQFQANNAGAGFGAGQSTGQFQAGNAGNLFNAGGQTAGLLSGLQQQYLANQGQGITAAGQSLDANNTGANAALQAEAARRGIPVQALGLLAQIGIPIAGLGGTSSGSSSGTSSGTGNQENQMSGAQQFAQIMSGIGSLGNLWNKKAS